MLRSRGARRTWSSLHPINGKLAPRTPPRTPEIRPCGTKDAEKRDMPGIKLLSGWVLVAMVPLAAVGCLGNFTPVQRVQEAAHDLTTAARFGRMDIALERVSRASRDDFVKRHAAWGSAVRVVDSEIQGLSLRDKEHADVFVTVGWQRIQESEMRTTHLTQHWRDHRGSWMLETEERTAGDVGLLR